MSLYAEQSPKQTPDSGLRDSSENFEIKIQSKFPYSNHVFLQTCHFLRSSGGFHNAPPISPSAGLLTKQETSHHFKVIARPLAEVPVVLALEGVWQSICCPCLWNKDSREKTSPRPTSIAALQRTFVLAWRRKKS